MSLHRSILLALPVLLAGFGFRDGAAQDAPGPASPFRWSGRVVPEAISPGGRAEVRILLTLAPGHLVYRERTTIRLDAPSGLRVGDVTFPESHRKSDPITGEKVDVFAGEPEPTFAATLTVPPDAAPGPSGIRATVRYQGCSPTLCFLPATEVLDIPFRIGGSAVAASPAAPASAGESGDRSGGGASLRDFSGGGKGLLARGRLWALLLAFGAGVLTSLTPCVYPLIPITIGIFGARAASSLWNRLTLSLVYVLGIAAMYSVLGLAAATTGAVFGQVMTNPWVVGGVTVIFAAFGASMLGAFEIRLPAGLQARLTRVGGKGYGGALAMGLVGGIIAAPCTGPALGAVLTYVAASRDLLYGFWLLFAFAIGMGVLFLVLGTFSGAVAALPKSGAWMEGVKSVLGIVMLAAALFYLKDIVPPLRGWQGRSSRDFAAAGGLIALGQVLGAVHRSFHDPSLRVRARKGLGVAACVAGVYVASGAFSAAPVESPEWVRDETEGLALARREGKPAMIDFYADWCAACVELDRETYSDPEVREALEGFIAIKVDFTREDAATRALQERYRLVGLPTILFFDRRGDEIPGKRLTGFVPPGRFLAHLADIH